jgi:hypothetical protein
MTRVVIVTDPPKISAIQQRRRQLMFKALTHHNPYEEFEHWWYLLEWARLGGTREEWPT